CKTLDNAFEVGVEFVAHVDKYRTRLIEQVGEIESYQRTLLEAEDRELSSEEAAIEWIGKYGAKYPSMDEIK
ncbi:MAG: PilZ domain-containing protein, partial [Alteromonadales bacterium]|nr:PilZ domain-containing protein [Alteromonadales bacterium]